MQSSESWRHLKCYYGDDANATLTIIIAMQGDPYTGKTTVANSLAKHLLDCHVISFDDILDDIYPGDLPPPSTPEEAETLMSRAFDVIAKRAPAIMLKDRKVIIVDSPLSRRAHLDKLMAIDVARRRKLIIVECKPKDSFIWEKRFNERPSSSYDDAEWYKPREWSHIPKFARDYTDDDEESVAAAAAADRNCLVSKLVIDTADHLHIGHLADTLRDMAKANKAQRVELTRMREKYGPPFTIGRTKDDPRLCPVHAFWCYVEGVADDVTCNACDRTVANSGAVYKCWLCSFPLHKACAELISGGESRTTFSPQNFPKIAESGKHSFRFPQQHKCEYCKQKGWENDFGCMGCTFASHLKSQLLPTILHHQGHEEHPLFFRLGHTEYVCKACRCPGSDVDYECVDDCGVQYHPQCALLPPVFLNHEHGGYTHNLEMMFHRDIECEDYVCALCFEYMNPLAWYYSCENCQLELHLQCAFQDFDELPPQHMHMQCDG